jgi:ATP-dependent DNA ligase
MSKPVSSKITASFVEPMLCLSTSSLPEGEGWEYELKLDGYRAIAIKTGRTVQLRSRNDKDFGDRFPDVRAALTALPADTVIDGELVALDVPAGPRLTHCRITLRVTRSCTTSSTF